MGTCIGYYNGCGCGCGCASVPTQVAYQPDVAFPAVAKGYGLITLDDNGVYRPLSGSGLTFTTSTGLTYNTDGSVNRGQISLNPPAVAAVNSVLGLLEGKLVRIGDAQVYQEGSTFLYRAGQWVVVPVSEKIKIIDPAKLKIGGGIILSLSCASGNMAELAKFPNTPNTVIYFDSTGTAQSYTLARFVEALRGPMCTSLPDAGTDPVTSVIVCTAAGLAKSTSLKTRDYYFDPIKLVYFQGTYYGMSNDPDAQVYSPQIPPLVNKKFENEFLDIDLSVQAGYDAVNPPIAVKFAVQGLNLVSGIEGTEVWALVLTVRGQDRMRLVSGGAIVGTWSNDCTEFVVPVPPEKKIRLEIKRQIGIAGVAREHAFLAVYLQAFLY